MGKGMSGMYRQHGQGYVRYVQATWVRPCQVCTGNMGKGMSGMYRQHGQGHVRYVQATWARVCQVPYVHTTKVGVYEVRVHEFALIVIIGIY